MKEGILIDWTKETLKWRVKYRNQYFAVDKIVIHKGVELTFVNLQDEGVPEKYRGYAETAGYMELVSDKEGNTISHIYSELDQTNLG